MKKQNMNKKPGVYYFMIICTLLISATGIKAQTIRYVKSLASGLKTGGSWANASADIQDMIDASSPGDQVWIAAGIYLPSREPDGTADSPRDFAFYLSNGVKIYGGFAGTETEISERIPGTNTTTLSGDIGTKDDFSDNCYHVVLSVNDGPATLVDGVGVVKANANNTDSMLVDGVYIYKNKGAAFYNYSSSPTISNCYFDTSIAQYGTGMYNNASSPTITNCIFLSCVATYGAGMYNEKGSAPAITNTLFDNNFAMSAGAGDGGGMYNDHSSPKLLKVTFSNHVASINGGGIYNINSSPEIINCFFYNNIAGDVGSNSKGGAIYNNHSSPAITNSVFLKNFAYNGGGMYNENNSAAAVLNCTFYNNSANTDANTVYSLSSSVTIKNCVLWGSTLSLTRNMVDSNSTGSVTYSDILGGFAGTGNIASDPDVIDPADPYGPDHIFGTADDGLSLQNCSLAINAGNNLGVSAKDIKGADRIQLLTTDMGAYESSSNAVDNSAMMAFAVPFYPSQAIHTQATSIQDADSMTVYAINCDTLISIVTGDGTTSSIKGSTIAKVWVDPDDIINNHDGFGFARRHYEILPANNAGTASGRIKLYFTDGDFNAYNDFFRNPVSQLPAFTNDPASANLLIYKYNGGSSDGTGLPGSYNGAATIINPADGDIKWNEIEHRWEISFDVTGFGGFFVGGNKPVILPIQWISVHAILNNQNQALINWKVEEQQVKYYEMQASEDGTNFSVAGTTSSHGDGQNSYSFVYPVRQSGDYFYRIKQVNKDGRSDYSSIIRLQNNSQSVSSVSLYPNPASEMASMNFQLKKAEHIQYTLIDNTGRRLFQAALEIAAGNTIVPLTITKLSAGMYYVEITGESFTSQIQLVKQ